MINTNTPLLLDKLNSTLNNNNKPIEDIKLTQYIPITTHTETPEINFLEYF